MDLLASESSDENDKVSFKINRNYAKNYEVWRKKEERQKLIDKYGDIDTSESSSSEEEIVTNPQVDKDWLRAYAVVRFQQPRLYKKGEKFFTDVVEPVVKHKQKTTTLKDHERKFILKKGGVESDEETNRAQTLGKSYFEEQEDIKKSFKEVLKESSDEETADVNGGLLVRKQKTAAEKKKEENEYLEWIKGERTELEDKEAATELAPLREYWNDPNLSEKEKVLRDYILNNGYIDQEESDEEKDDDDGEDDDNAPDFDAEEEFLEKAENYEQKYNFRHEEPGGDEIKSYPRVIETSVRTKDMRRADKRKKRMEKKRSEGEKRREEIKLLQKLQREEKMEKLEKLRKIADNPQLLYDLEADFEPSEHNKIMQKYFNESYYGETEDASGKPVFEYDAAVDDEPDDWWQSRLKEEDQEETDTAFGSSGVNGEIDYSEDGVDDPNFIMDADYDPNKDYRTERKTKKKSKKKVVEKLPLFDPTTKTFDEYIDEYLKDRIDKLPFMYREVVPNDFGLSTNEILQANEKELNAWVSVKKMSAYRSKQDEFADKRKFVARATNEERKRKILPSLFQKSGELSKDKDSKKKKKRKKKTITSEPSEMSPPSSSSLQAAVSATTLPNQESNGSNSEKQKIKSKKRKFADVNDTDTVKLDSSLDISDEVETKSAKKMKKDVHKILITNSDNITAESDKCMSPVKGSTHLVNVATVNDETGDTHSSLIKSKKKKKTKKQAAETEHSITPTIKDRVKKKKLKKHKKKKISISNFNSKNGAGSDPQTADKREIKRQLMKVMSAARLSKYGIGPNAVKSVSKKKKKKKNVQS